MGKRYPLYVLVAVGIVVLMGLAAIAANETQEDDIPYNGYVQLQAKLFPELNNTSQDGFKLQLETHLYLPPTAPVPPKGIKGIYVSGWVVGSDSKMNELIKLARETEINAFVIDIKDDSGLVSWNSNVKLAIDTKANHLKHRDFKGLVQKLKKENIYLIGRVVSFKDAHLAKARPDRALRLKNGSKVWEDDDWISGFQKENWEYIVSIAKEAAEMGFDEIQFDYVRFPALANRPTQVAQLTKMTKDEAIDGFLNYAKKELAKYNVPISADIFGMVTSMDDIGIGQRFEQLTEAVAVLSPMVYPSHYSNGNFNLKSPESSPYETVYRSIKDAIARVPKDSDVRIRPWLQDFSMKVKYGPSEVRKQIQALKDLGIDEWLLWNPGSRYTRGALYRDSGHDVKLSGTLQPGN